MTPKQQRFLAVYGQAANLTQAAQMAGVDRSTHYHWLRDPHYRQAFVAAHEAALDRLEEEAWRRAMAGSDRLLMFLLSAHRPRYRPEWQPTINAELQQIDDQELLAAAQRELRQMGYESLEQLWQAQR